MPDVSLTPRRCELRQRRSRSRDRGRSSARRSRSRSRSSSRSSLVRPRQRSSVSRSKSFENCNYDHSQPDVRRPREQLRQHAYSPKPASSSGVASNSATVGYGYGGGNGGNGSRGGNGGEDDSQHDRSKAPEKARSAETSPDSSDSSDSDYSEVEMEEEEEDQAKTYEKEFVSELRELVESSGATPEEIDEELTILWDARPSDDSDSRKLIPAPPPYPCGNTKASSGSKGLVVGTTGADTTKAKSKAMPSNKPKKRDAKKGSPPVDHLKKPDFKLVPKSRLTEYEKMVEEPEVVIGKLSKDEVKGEVGKGRKVATGVVAPAEKNASLRCEAVPKAKDKTPTQKDKTPTGNAPFKTRYTNPAGRGKGSSSASTSTTPTSSTSSSARPRQTPNQGTALPGLSLSDVTQDNSDSDESELDDSDRPILVFDDIKQFCCNSRRRKRRQ